jgi:hypothetical protein
MVLLSDKNKENKMPYLDLKLENNGSAILNTQYIVYIAQTQKGNAYVGTTRDTFYSVEDYQTVVQRLQELNKTKTR